MKNKSITLIILVLFANSFIHAQINGRLYGEKGDFIALAKRPLLVELQEEDPDVIKSLSKKEKTADKLKEYKTFIADYNKLIKLAVLKYWKYNDKIEFKTVTEVKKLKDSNNDKYAVLSYIQLHDHAKYGGALISSNKTIYALSYSRIESKESKPDYKICMPSSGIREGDKYYESDFKLALTGAQAHLKWMIQNDKTNQFQEYLEIVVNGNCPKLKSLVLQAEQGFLQQKVFMQKELTEAEAKQAYGHNLNFVTADELNTSYTGNKKGTAVLFIIPYGTTHPTSLGPMTSVQQVALLACYKVVVNCETNEILWVEVPGKISHGSTQPYLKESEFKNMGECK